MHYHLTKTKTVNSEILMSFIKRHIMHFSAHGKELLKKKVLRTYSVIDISVDTFPKVL